MSPVSWDFTRLRLHSWSSCCPQWHRVSASPRREWHRVQPEEPIASTTYNEGAINARQGVGNFDDYLESDWRLRNGHVHVRLVSDGAKAVLYATKEAAHRGEVVCADTLGDYRDALGDVELVSLYGVED